jgi:hypothetical protein
MLRIQVMLRVHVRTWKSSMDMNMQEKLGHSAYVGKQHVLRHAAWVFATVPISRINSWVSWFIFNLQKNK